MPAILTPVEKLKEGDKFYIQNTLCVAHDDGTASFAKGGNGGFSYWSLRVLFPDGVPVIVPDKPKEVRCVVTVDEDGTPRVDGEVCVSIGDWLDILLENSKVYDLILVEREEGK